MAVEEDLDESERSMPATKAIRSFWILRMWSGLWEMFLGSCSVLFSFGPFFVGYMLVLGHFCM